MTHKEYIEFLLSKDMYDKSYHYGISPYYDEDKKIYTDKMVDFIMGFNCCLNINTEVVSVGERSVLFKIKYLGTEHEFRVYCHMGVSPKEFLDRVSDKIVEHFRIYEEGDEMFDKLKEYYEGEKKKLYGALGKEVKKQLSDWRNNE
jgi:hypothetical protein